MNDTTTTPDKAAILAALAVLFDPADVIELRAFAKGGKKRTDAGYFDSAHWPDLANHAAQLSNSGAAVYITLNPVDPQLLSRYNNRIEAFATATTTDKQIVRRRWLLIDLDPARPSNTSATDAQLAAAHVKAQAIYKHLKGIGWADPLVAKSGNGYHLLYAIDLPNDDDSTALLKGVLAALADQFDDAQTKVDRSVFNSARICKLYGTAANKGDNTPAAPWRLSTLVSTPARVLVTTDQLRLLQPLPVAPTKVPTRSTQQSTFNLEDFLSRHGLDFSTDRHDGRERFKLKACPFNSEHVNGEAAVFRDTTGKLGFHCMHDSCSGNDWKTLRAHLDGPRQQRTPQWDYDAFPEVGDDGASFAALQTDAKPFSKREVLLICGADLEPVPIDWLWKFWLAKGKFHILAGQPGVGKTTLALAMAATVTIAGRWPDGTPCAGGNVLIWSGEDDVADTLLPRCIASGADRHRLHFVTDTRTERGESVPFDPSTDLPQLEAAVNKIGGVSLIIVDPVVSAVAGDSHKNAEVRRSLQPLVEMASRLGAAVLGITHLSKGGSGADPVSRVIGSIAFSALARVVLVAAKVTGEDGQSKRVLMRGKANCGPDEGGFAYHLDQSEPLPGLIASSASWGEFIPGTARDVMAEPEFQPKNDDQNDAIALLKGELVSDCWTPASQAMKPLQDAGFTKKQIWNVCNKVGVIRHKLGFGPKAATYWRLPGGADIPDPTVKSDAVITIDSISPLIGSIDSTDSNVTESGTYGIYGDKVESMEGAENPESEEF